MDWNSGSRAMVAGNVEQLYQEYIKPLPMADRLRLVEMIAKDAAETHPGA
jgi:hypothetical protein